MKPLGRPIKTKQNCRMQGTVKSPHRNYFATKTDRNLFMYWEKYCKII